MSVHLSTMYKPALQRLLRAGSFDFVKVYAKLTVVLCIFIALASAALGLRTALKAGPIWDDPTTIVMMQVLIGIGAQPEISYETGIAWIEVPGYRGAGYYGAVTQFAAHALETIASGESWLKTSYSAQAVAWRHLVCFIMIMCAAVALFLTATIISGDRRLGIFMVAALLSTPVFIGISVIDEKDAPIAAGMHLGTDLAVQQVNASGGINGHPLQLTYVDLDRAVVGIATIGGPDRGISFGTL